MIGRIARSTSFHATFIMQLFDGLMVGEQGMRRRCETELPIVLQAFPLGKEVEAEAAGAAFAFEQGGLGREDETESRYAFNALVAAGNEEVDVARLQMDGNAPEAAHGINDVAFAMAGHHCAQGFDGVEDACGGFAMHHGHVGNGRIGGEKIVQRIDRGHFVLRALQHIVADAMNAGHLCHPFAVGAIHQQEQMAVLGQGARDDGLDAKGARTLHDDAFVAIGLAHIAKGQQVAAHGADEVYELEIARAEVAEHGLFNGERCGERAGGEEEFVGHVE